MGNRKTGVGTLREFREFSRIGISLFPFAKIRAIRVKLFFVSVSIRG